MVAKIESGKSIRGIIGYNEDKVTLGEAVLLMASGFAAEVDRMSFNQKVNRFKRLIELNARVKTNALHISLNFDVSDKLDNARLQQIASAYMERIGFGDQPFLVYRHLDAYHPHLHIATTNVTRNAERIDIHGIGYRLSEPARKALEKEFGLVEAEGREKSTGQKIRAAIYGEKPTKKVISNTVAGVMRQYCYGSFAEYQAILSLFNIRADRGSADSQMFLKGGLQYSILDGGGKPVGVPIKASSIYCKPTLKELEKRFERNKGKKAEYKADLKAALDQLLFKTQYPDREVFTAELLKAGIDVVFRFSDQGQLYGVTYVDHRNKVVFNGSDLGKAYSAKALSEHFEKAKLLNSDMGTRKQDIRAKAHLRDNNGKEVSNNPAPVSFLKMALAQTEVETGIRIPKRRKKRRKGTQVQQEQQLTI